MVRCFVLLVGSIAYPNNATTWFKDITVITPNIEIKEYIEKYTKSNVIFGNFKNRKEMLEKVLENVEDDEYFFILNENEDILSGGPFIENFDVLERRYGSFDAGEVFIMHNPVKFSISARIYKMSKKINIKDNSLVIEGKPKLVFAPIIIRNFI